MKLRIKPVKRNKSKRDVLNEFREDRGQSNERPDTIHHNRIVSGYKSESLKNFEARYSKIDDDIIEKFDTLDFVYYFQAKSEEFGVKYWVRNIARDRAVFRKLREHYTNKEITEMIDFVYLSNQNYLEKNRLAPTVLVSGWNPTIFADSQLWKEGKYKPKKDTKTVSEWDGNENEIGVII